MESEEVKSHLYSFAEVVEIVESVGHEVLHLALTPTSINSLDERKYQSSTQWLKLIELEMSICTAPELLRVGSHLLCVARKK